MNLRLPALVHLAFTRVRGNPARRLMIVLRTRGCTHALRSHGGCTFCGFRELSAKGHRVAETDIIVQFQEGLRSYDLLQEEVLEIDIYNSGSFLSRKEIPAQAGVQMFRIIARDSRILKVSVESRPEFIIREEILLAGLRNIVKDKILEVGVGLETIRDDIRNEVLHKGFTLSEFRRACEILASHGVDLLSYVLLKPPGLSEGEAIQDTIDTISFLDQLRRSLPVNVKVALQPTFVPRDTPLEKLYLEGDFIPPRLWSVTEVLKETSSIPMEIEVGLSDEGLADGRTASNCELCSSEVLRALEAFNQTQDRGCITGLECPCRLQWKDGLK